ncbi:hypothetical protein [Cellulomonas sp. URHE0023]|uniref:hypothetical protein n=1 Tax=Cellulomonas sp. URHE0023 TaxID=1380354 RepID=UPI000487C486|nr:hypothetical protein [Cellulomonas sp. URHE0023]
MNEHSRDAHDPADAELIERINRALRSRATEQPDPAVVTARIEAELAQLGQAPVNLLVRRSAKVVAAGVVTSVLVVAGAGAAAAANPYSPVARTVENVAHAVGIDWSAMPDGYTREQYEAFWATYTVDDMETLSALWNIGATETKARAGQMILDGQTPPVTPSAPAEPPSDDQQDARDAFWDAGYTSEDVGALSELWSIDPFETKARAGQMILDGEQLPVAPGTSTPAP